MKTAVLPALSYTVRAVRVLLSIVDIDLEGSEIAPVLVAEAASPWDTVSLILGFEHSKTL